MSSWLRNACCVAALSVLCACNTTSRDSNEINSAKETVGLLLADPLTAQFDHISVSNGVVCGLVNSKNLAGAYTGFEGFIVENSHAKIGEQSAEFNDSFSKKCGEPAKSKFAALWMARADRLASEVILEAEKLNSTSQ